MRSLPPPMRSFSLYSAGLHRTGSPNSSNTWLKATRCPYRSVSASTPSQSKISARAARSATRAHQALPALPKRRMWSAASCSTAARVAVNSDGGSQLSRSSAWRRKSRLDFM